MKGLTIIEILIVIAILVLLAALGAGALPDFGKNVELNDAALRSTSLLDQARVQTLSSKDATQYGVHFEADKMVLFRGSSFSSTDSSNEEHLLPRGVLISQISLNGGGSDVVFKRLIGETNEYGTITFRIKLDVQKIRTVQIEKTGVVSVE